MRQMFSKNQLINLIKENNVSSAVDVHSPLDYINLLKGNPNKPYMWIDGDDTSLLFLVYDIDEDLIYGIKINPGTWEFVYGTFYYDEGGFIDLEEAYSDYKPNVLHCHHLKMTNYQSTTLELYLYTPRARKILNTQDLVALLDSCYRASYNGLECLVSYYEQGGTKYLRVVHSFTNTSPYVSKNDFILTGVVYEDYVADVQLL